MDLRFLVVGGRFTVSLDFELHWGVHDRLSVDEYRTHLLGAREIVPRLLELFVARRVSATWATVGMLFCGDRDELLTMLPKPTPTYADGMLSPYRLLGSIGADERTDPFHFAPGLV